MSLWQKPEAETPRPSTPSTPATSPAPTMNHRPTQVANIGQSVQIKGELMGNEDLTIDGRVDGKITLKDHHLTIGPNGHITADVNAKSVQVNGEVTGNITADDKVEIAPAGSVEGDIRAPRVALADGSSFKGSIDMGGKSKASTGSGSSTQPAHVAMAASSPD